MKLREVFSRNKKIDTDTTVKIDLYSDPTTIDPTVVSSTATKILIVQGYSICTTDLVEVGVRSTDPVTGQKLRRNGRYARFKIIKHTICASKTMTDTIDKRSDIDAFLHVRECETVHQLQDVVSAITSEIIAKSGKGYVRTDIESVKTRRIK